VPKKEEEKKGSLQAKLWTRLWSRSDTNSNI